MHLGEGDQPAFPPEVAAHLIKLACELPDSQQRSLSLWTCSELAQTLIRDRVVEAISPQSMQRILESQKLKPWRVHFWLSPTKPRDDAFRAQTMNICDLYTRALSPEEVVLSFDEKTSIQPRPRLAKTKPAKPGKRSVKVEHSYRRDGALNLLAAFNTRSGRVIGICRPRKRQAEFIELLEEIERQHPDSITQIHLICDNVPMHSGTLVQAMRSAAPPSAR